MSPARRTLSIALLAVGVTCLPMLFSQATASNPAPNPVVVELFTSQGCSSCPPADVLLGSLAARRDVVAITRAVTYWDRLGWTDTLGREGNTQLQNAYAQRHLRGAGVYTPQIVVQGGDAAVGSNKGGVTWLIDRAAQAPASASLRIDGMGDARRLVLGGVSGGPAHVSVLALRSRVDVRIGSGENGGRVIAYHNVVVGEQAIGAWKGGPAMLTIPQAALAVRGADRFAVIVQRDGAGPIVAAHYL